MPSQQKPTIFRKVGKKGGIDNNGLYYSRCIIYTSIYAAHRMIQAALSSHARTDFRTAVPCWGQTTYNLTGLSPKRDCGSKRVNATIEESIVLPGASK